MAYATPADFIARVDVRRLGDLGLDDGTRVSPSNLTTNTRLLASLNDASGLIDANLLRSGRYKHTDLTTLATTTDNANFFLIRITVDLAYGLMLEARGYSAEQTEDMAPGYAKALAYLDKLASGEWIFGTAPVVDAGGTHIQALSTNVTLLTQGAERWFGNLNYQRNQANHHGNS